MQAEQDKTFKQSKASFAGDFKGSLGECSRSDLEQGYAVLEKPGRDAEYMSLYRDAQREATKDDHLVTDGSINL